MNHYEIRVGTGVESQSGVYIMQNTMVGGGGIKMVPGEKNENEVRGKKLKKEKRSYRGKN